MWTEISRMQRFFVNGKTVLGSIALLGLTSFPAAAQGGKVWAVIVGIDDYVRDSIPDLRYAVSDAKLFAQALQDVVKVPKEQVFLMTSDAVEESAQPKLTNVVYRLGWLKEKVKPEDTLIFYFAGHGVNMEGQSFLLTEEADNRNAATLKFSALRGGDLTDLVRASSAGKAMVLLDACRNSPTAKADVRLDLSFSQALTLGGTSATMFSCSVGEKSWEWDEKKHGFFTYFLVEGLRQQAALADGRVTLQSLNTYVSKQVAETTARLAGAKQTPVLNYSGSDPEWLLAKVAAPAGLAKSKNPEADSNKFLAELEAARARIDSETALRKAAEDRANAEVSRRKELETRLLALEKQAPGGGANDATVATLRAQLADAQAQIAKFKGTNLVAYGDRAGGQTEDGVARNQALQAEVEKLRLENQALRSRLGILETQIKSVGLQASSRDVKLEVGGELLSLADLEGRLSVAESVYEHRRKELEASRVELKRWSSAAVAVKMELPPPGPMSETRRWSMAAVQVGFELASQQPPPSNARQWSKQAVMVAAEMRVLTAEFDAERAQRDVMGARLAVVQGTYGASLKQTTPADKVAEVAFLKDQAEAQRQATVTYNAKVAAVENALDEARTRLNEANLRIAKYEAIIKDLTAQVAEKDRQLAAANERYRELDKERVAALERARKAEEKLIAMENSIEDTHKSVPIARDFTRVTRRARLEDFSGTIKTGPEMNEDDFNRGGKK